MHTTQINAIIQHIKGFSDSEIILYLKTLNLTYSEICELFSTKAISFKVFSEICKRIPLNSVEFDKSDLDREYL